MSAPSDLLPWFEVPRTLVEPVVSALRLANTALDLLFYDVGALTLELLRRGWIVSADPDAPSASAGQGQMPGGLHEISLSALADPEGSIVVVDAARPPYVLPHFSDVREFLARLGASEAPVRTLSVTGVGSSALGSVAFAWNLSQALGEPVAAIVPGYGVADVVEQALGGWFGLGLHLSFVGQATQAMLAHAAPRLARLGHGLLTTVPGHRTARETGAPEFERGSGASDVLHAILKASPRIERLYGHSKGALVIENAVLDLNKATLARLRITTFGCPIGKAAPPRNYRQFLGWFDPLGLLNSWGNAATNLIASTHSTNTLLWLSMQVARLAAERVGAARVATEARPALTDQRRVGAAPAAAPLRSARPRAAAKRRRDRR